MTAKEFLSQARGMDRRIDKKTERVERIEARLEAGRLNRLTGMPRGGVSDWTDTANMLIDMEKDLNSEIREMCRVKRLVKEAIHAVEKTRWQELLELYYINEYTWEQVAETMHLDRRWVTRMHGKALLAVKVPMEFQN